MTDKTKELKRLENTEEFIKKAKIKHGDKYNYSKVVYENAKKHIIIICKEHDEFEQTPDKHLQGGCKKCGIENSKLKQTGNIEEFIQKAKLKHGDNYDYSKVNYTKANKKVIIICNKHGEFEQIPTSHLKGFGCNKCGIENSKLKQTGNTEEFIQKAKLKHGDRYDYSKVDYIKANKKVIIICKIHDYFEQTPNNHIMGQGCIKCGIIEQHLLQRSNTEEFIKKSIEIHENKYDYSKVDYEKNNIKVIIYCKEHGDFLQTPSQHLVGSGCNKCGIENARTKMLDTSEIFIEKSIKIHGNKYDYSKVEYNNTYSDIIIICKKHGEFLTTPNYHLQRTYGGCLKCCKNGYSKKQIYWLNFLQKYNNITIQHAENYKEYLIPNTKYKADGYCINTNTIYEFHGTIYHGDPRFCNKNDFNYLGKNYGELYQKTLDKENLIKDLGYNLVVMWEYDWNKINKSIKVLQRKFRNFKLH